MACDRSVHCRCHWKGVPVVFHLLGQGGEDVAGFNSGEDDDNGDESVGVKAAGAVV